MPQRRHTNCLVIYRDRSSKGRSGTYHDCWRGELYCDGERIRLGRVSFSKAPTREVARAYFS